MCKHVWTSEYPTNPGWYWFYGRHYGDEKHSMGVVNVFPIQNGVCHTLNGQFMFKQDKHEGVFSPIDKPVISAEIAGGNFETP